MMSTLFPTGVLVSAASEIARWLLRTTDAMFKQQHACKGSTATDMLLRVVVNNCAVRLVEPLSKVCLSGGKADRVCNSLSQRACMVFRCSARSSTFLCYVPKGAMESCVW